MSGSQAVRLPSIASIPVPVQYAYPASPILLSFPLALSSPPSLTLPLPDKTEEVRRLGLGRLLDDMSRKMQRKVQSSSKKEGEKDPLKILVHSTHDTALAGLLSTLDVYDDK